MKKHFVHTIISVMVFWGAYSPAVALSAEDNQVFLEMINKIREAPYEYAIKYLEGCTNASLKANGIEPDTTFARYKVDGGLTAMAETESRLMAGEKIPESEEKSPVYRFSASTGGVVSFFNFMPRDTAFKLVINYLFKNELKTNAFNYILSEKYSSAGIAISAGKVGSGNAWFVAISLRSSELVSEIQMLNLINQARANPDNIWEYTQLNQADVFTLNPNFPDLIYSEYKPLFFNASLSASARAHLLETQTDLETDSYHGYQGEVVQESDVEIACLTEKDGLSVGFLFKSLMFSYELVEWPSSSVVFLRDVQNVGSNITYQPGDNKIGSSVLSFVVGKNDLNISSDENSSSNTDRSSRVYCLLFSDDDGDGLYAPGEELRQKTVTVSVYTDDVGEMQEIQRIDTDNAGHFSIPLEINRQYSFTATIEDVQFREDVFITSDQFVKLGYSPPSLENNLHF